MLYTAKQLKNKVNALAKANQVTSQEVLQNYMFERILYRISKSRYADKFVLKGGLLVSSMSGINSRTTMDMDAWIKGIKLDKKRLFSVLNEILSLDVQDGIRFELLASESIREEEEYGGFRFRLQGRLGNLDVSLSLDLSSGDVITPAILDYRYPMIFEEDHISIKAYPIETILAEKLQTMLDRNGAKGRMKDYYDIHYFVSARFKDIEMNMLRQAVNNTFAHRKTLDDLARAEEILESIFKNKDLIRRWLDFSPKHEYSKNITYSDVILSARNLVALIKAES